MIKHFYLIACIFLLFAVLGSTNAQSSLTHDTGPVQMTVYDDGAIGEFVFDGNTNAMFTGGIIGGNLNLLGGMIGSFVGRQGPIIWDLINVTSFNGFSSDPFFNQISSADVVTNMVPGADTHFEFKSNTDHKFIFLRKIITNNSTFDWQNMYFGIFADWDVGGANYLLNSGGYDTQRNMIYQFENGGAGDQNFYGILIVNAPPNTVRGTVDKDISVMNEPQLREDIFYLMTSTDFVPITADGDYRTYLSSGPYSIPMGESITLDYAFLAGTSLADLQANADDAIVYGPNLPVELTSFTANVNNEGNVVLNWSTATEINNQLFEIERKSSKGQYLTIGFVEGYGTTSEPQEYSYTDDKVGTGTFFYRLKQIDFGGQYEYSDEIEIEVNGPLAFALEQNYPNPFNPSTNIKFSVPTTGQVKLAVYNLVGEEVAVLVNEIREAGFYEITFNASNLPSGTYFYKIESSIAAKVKKMILMK